MIKHISLTKIKLLGVILGSLLVIGFLVSIFLFKSSNPFITGYGLSQILFSNRESILINTSPEIFLAKPQNSENSLIQMMSKDGYSYNAEKRLGSLLVFEKGGKEKLVFLSINKYYSMWKFQ